MIVDTSALIAILKGEPDAIRYANAFQNAAVLRISAATYLESSVVAYRSNRPEISARLDDALEASNFIIEPFTESQARIARQAYRDYGKGSGHRAQLNFGDCFSYALARDKREPLLYKGDDFVHTDIRPAL